MNTLDDYIKAYEEAEKVAEMYDDREPLPLHEPVKMTKKQEKALFNRLYKVIYGGIDNSQSII